jgi:hypothetical protein
MHTTIMILGALAAVRAAYSVTKAVAAHARRRLNTRFSLPPTPQR